MENVQRFFGVLILIVSLWFALLGSLSAVGLASGVVIAITVNLLFRDAIVTHISPRIISHITLGIIYAPLFIIEIFKASFRLSWLTLQPRPKLTPGIIKLPLDLDSPVAMTMLAIMVNLTPGTLSLDLDQKNKDLYIHWANMTTQNPDLFKKHSLGNLEKWARRIFQR